MFRNKQRFNYYAIVRGMDPGIYREWYGGNGAEARVRGVSGALYKGFDALWEAIEWYMENTDGQEPLLWFEEEPYSYFAVIEGNEIGIYNNWLETNRQLVNFRNPCFKGFHSLKEAKEWYTRETGRKPKMRFSDGQK